MEGFSKNSGAILRCLGHFTSFEINMHTSGIKLIAFLCKFTLCAPCTRCYYKITSQQMAATLLSLLWSKFVRHVRHSQMQINK